MEDGLLPRARRHHGRHAIGSSGNTAVNVGTAIGAIWGPLGAAIGGALFGMGVLGARTVPWDKLTLMTDLRYREDDPTKSEPQKADARGMLEAWEADIVANEARVGLK